MSSINIKSLQKMAQDISGHRIDMVTSSGGIIHCFMSYENSLMHHKYKIPCGSLYMLDTDVFMKELLSKISEFILENTKCMNIHSVPGTLLEFAFPQNGDDKSVQNAQKYLRFRARYHLENRVVHGYSTDVYLQEFPGIRFNSVQFRNIN